MNIGNVLDLQRGTSEANTSCFVDLVFNYTVKRISHKNRRFTTTSSWRWIHIQRQHPSPTRVQERLHFCQIHLIARDWVLLRTLFHSIRHIFCMCVTQPSHMYTRLQYLANQWEFNFAGQTYLYAKWAFTCRLNFSNPSPPFPFPTRLEHSLADTYYILYYIHVVFSLLQVNLLAGYHNYYCAQFLSLKSFVTYYEEVLRKWYLSPKMTSKCLRRLRKNLTGYLNSSLSKHPCRCLLSTNWYFCTCSIANLYQPLFF